MIVHGIDLTAPALDQPIVVFDCETTGIGEDHAVVECAAVRFEGGIPVAQWSSLINPGRDIPPEATAVHGITNAGVADKPRLGDVAEHLRRVAAGAWPCAYNAPFDRGFLHATIADGSCALFDPACEWVDPLVVVRDADRFVPGTGRHKLEAACKRHGVQIEGAHRALADALACGGLLYALRERVGKMTLGELLARTAKRRAVQDAEFRAYRDGVKGAAQ